MLKINRSKPLVHIAFKSGALYINALLATHGADLTNKNTFAQTPYDYFQTSAQKYKNHVPSFYDYSDLLQEYDQVTTEQQSNNINFLVLRPYKKQIAKNKSIKKTISEFTQKYCILHYHKEK